MSTTIIRGRMQLLMSLTIAILVLVLLSAVIGYVWLRTSLPTVMGKISLQGLEESVTITRDNYDLPTISAQNGRDAVFALGFVHAQDRLFQMDLMRHYGAGRLSEWFGRTTLDSDRLMRTIGLYEVARRQYTVLDKETREALDAYAAGVNAFLSQRTGALPPEYYLLRASPEPWRPADTLVWGKIMDLQLSGNFRRELLRARLSQQLSPAEMAVLYPSYPKDAAIPWRDVTGDLPPWQLDALYASLPPELGPQYASNNWVVDGNHSASGRPILANDPHLGFAAPGPWYLARIETPSLNVAGATAPGTPFVIVGHNDRIAWGTTNTTSDVADLFVEKLDPDDAGQYITPTGPRPFDTHQEEIGVRDSSPYALTIRTTRHGPVISDLANVPRDFPTAGHVFALRATWLEDDDRSPDALWSVMRARDWHSFETALSSFVAPQQNIVYADIDGNVGLILPGRIPIRRKGDGGLPVPGWINDYEWTGFIPREALPVVHNPPNGRIVTANNQITPDGYPYFLSYDWEPPYRAQRITTLLDATPVQSVVTTASIQGDTLSLMAKQLLPLMLHTTPHNTLAVKALQRLRDWDGQTERGRAEPLIFVAWLREFNRVMFAQKLGSSFSNYWGLHPVVIYNILTTHQEWCGDRNASSSESCGEQLSMSLDSALRQLTADFGEDIAAWTWGRPHQATFSHPVLSKFPALAWLFDVRIPADGSYDTINNGTPRIQSTIAPYSDVFGTTLRMVVDMAEPTRARFMITPGQSGNPLSPHYSDLARPWRDLLSLQFSEDAGGGTLLLNPAR
jgi:penicillin G amidase